MLFARPQNVRWFGSTDICSDNASLNFTINLYEYIFAKRFAKLSTPTLVVHTSSCRRQLSFFTLSLQSLRWSNLYVILRIHIFPHIIYILCTVLSTLCILTVFTRSYLGINSSLRASILISFLLFHSSWKVIIELWHRSSFPGVLIQNRIHSVPKILYYPK